MSTKPKKTIPRLVNCHIKAGDKVVLLTGPKERRGKTGTVVRILTKKHQAIVEGDCAALEVKNTKANPQTGEAGGRSKRPRPIHVSNLALLDPTTGKATRVRREQDATGHTVRVAIKSGHKFVAATK